MDGTLVHQPKEFYPDGVPEAFTMSRTAYENLLRCLVARVPNVRFMKGTVSAVTPSPEDQGRISSVTYRGEDGKSTEVENAEVVVGMSVLDVPDNTVHLRLADCSGLSHSGLTWLKRAGYHPPTKQTYNPHMRYYTVEFTVDPTVMQKLCPTGFDKTTPVLLFTFNFLDKEQRIFGFMQIEHNRSLSPLHIVMVWVTK